MRCHIPLFFYENPFGTARAIWVFSYRTKIKSISTITAETIKTAAAAAAACALDVMWLQMDGYSKGVYVMFWSQKDVYWKHIFKMELFFISRIQRMIPRETRTIQHHKKAAQNNNIIVVTMWVKCEICATKIWSKSYDEVEWKKERISKDSL